MEWRNIPTCQPYRWIVLVAINFNINLFPLTTRASNPGNLLIYWRSVNERLTNTFTLTNTQELRGPGGPRSIFTFSLFLIEENVSY